MSLTEKQFGVLKRIIVGLSIALCIVGLGSYMNPFGYNETFEPINKLHIAILCCLVPTFFLAVSIGRLAKHRFLTPEDIDGGGLLGVAKGGLSGGAPFQSTPCLIVKAEFLLIASLSSIRFSLSACSALL